MKKEGHDIDDLKYDIEIKMAGDCYSKEKKAVKSGKPFKCTCSDPYSWSDKEVLEWHGIKDDSKPKTL